MAFKKGQSGNPGGRPKENTEVRDLARQHTAEAIERLAHWMRSDNAKASVSSSINLIERGWGKPEQPVTGADGGPIETTDATPREIARVVLGILREAGTEKAK